MTSMPKKDVVQFLLNLFGFLLLWEWLRPLKVVTDTAELYIFIVFIGICFIFSFLKVKSWLSAIFKLIAIFILLNHIYFGDSILGLRWLPLFFSDLSYNVGLMFEANWMEMTNVFRSFLFFILLWLMSYLVYYWMIVQKKIFSFFALTIIYITVLDTFSPYDAEGAIVRSVLCGFLMLGLVNIQRVLGTERVTHFKGIVSKWIIPLTVAILFTTTIGYVAPKASPQWPDPVPFLKGYGKGGVSPGGGNSVKKIGYGTNDSYLGGPFIGDNTPVFRAAVGKRHYWRVETKDVYTGKGWEASKNYTDNLFTNENDVLSWFEAGADRESYEADIEMLKVYPHITYPTGLISVSGFSNQDLTYSVDPVTEKILSLQDEESFPLERYSLSYEQPVYVVDEVKSVNSRDGKELNDEFFQAYTQLPEELPERVRELAEEITKDLTNRYDQVVAIERYFKDASFIYETTDVAVPGRNDDYVDQFLFETQAGYCDNFSTSMVVLLRSLDIPARWVKGYTEGTYLETLNENQRVFEVTNNNAHSWVEVYFPNFGWIEFEPTKGFSNLSNFVYNTSSTVTNTNTDEVEIQRPTPELVEESTPEMTEVEQNSTVELDEQKGLMLSWKDTLFIILTIILVVFVLVKTRLRWYPFVAIIRFKYRKDDQVYFKAYQALLTQLDRVGLKRKDGQTLREYAAYVDKFYRSEDMQKLTQSYEKALYRNNDAKKEWVDSAELWENLIKRVSS
ncbi:DUF3488 and DUF4129 domain-containing transglutaminase family protein [Bacillus sp. PS06]|uniref:transglutaminase TgpA family protein n=1 Tax=Bacillus sp. PS06 TaxID=2764176 RepID=UPI001782E84F|nr:transglutaminaseTgpA domain-containing protein [Bacillus sp. PS06]MBD8070762.1 DUF4129 domain-containing protein [Bacillus sp. PS06]